MHADAGRAPCQIHLVNIQGLITTKKNKNDFLRLVTAQHPAASRIIAVTETHLSTQHFNAEINKYFPDYNVVRADRDTIYETTDEYQLHSCGGCLLLTSPDIITLPQITFSNGNCELVVATCPELHMDIIVVYRPPRPNCSLPKFTEITGKIQAYLGSREKDYHITLLGDFNFPERIVKWIKIAEGTFADAPEGTTGEKLAFQALHDLANEYNLHQLVDKPTRHDALLDLLFTNCQDAFEDCAVSNINPLSDHNLVSFNVVISRMEAAVPNKVTPAVNDIRNYNFKRTNHLALEAALSSTNWDQILGDETNIETANEKFTTAIIKAAVTARVPKYNDRSTAANKSIAKLLGTRSKLQGMLQQKTIRTKDKHTHLNRIREINQELQAKIAGIHDTQEAKVIHALKANPQAFFKYANRNKQCRSNIGPLKSGDTYIRDPKQMAQLLSDQYKSVFSVPRTDMSLLQVPTYTFAFLNDITITDEKVTDAVKEIQLTSAPGPDGITPFFYKEFLDQVCYPIKKIWRLSLDTGKLPEGTALAYITPIFKGGAKSLPANYRPVSLTNHLTKIFERILRKDILKHLETNQLMNHTQHGFRSGRSTHSQLLHYLDSVLTTLEEGDEVDSIYLDFAKAFDKVDHNILLTKVASLNIGGKVLHWLETFLKCRRQSVKVEEEFSESVPVTSGVPQGSVLGPLLFLILMIDIDDDILDSILGSFADDTRIWGTLRDFLQLNPIQAELNKVYHWAQINNMEFNEPKFEQMHFGTGNIQLQYTSPTGSVITTKDTIKDLGVIFEDNLLFHKHIISTVAKGHRIAGWSLRTFKSRETNVMLTLLKSLVVSQVEYACII